MPNCFQLFRKGAEATPRGKDAVLLSVVDEEICAAVGDPVHPRHYCRSWFDSIGWMIAVRGMTFPQIRLALTKPCELKPASAPHKYNAEFTLECAVHQSGEGGAGAYSPLQPGRARPGDKSCTVSWLNGDGQPDSEDLVPVLDYLEAHFETTAWVEIGRRA